MSETSDLLKRLPTDLGGLPAEPIVRTEHELLPWEKRCHALADVLDFHKIINTEEKRRGVEALGAEMVGKLTYFGVAYSSYSGDLRRAEEVQALTDPTVGVQTWEMTLELSYGCTVRPGLLVQPCLQFLVNPGGNKAVPNALALGLNVVFNF